MTDQEKELLTYKSNRVEMLEKELEIQSNIKNNLVEKVYNLEKENEELKKSVTEKNSVVEKLKAQIKPLEDRICSLRRKNATLENKVEKMKRCGNCKYIAINTKMDSAICTVNKKNEYKKQCDTCDKWELAD